MSTLSLVIAVLGVTSLNVVNGCDGNEKMTIYDLNIVGNSHTDMSKYLGDYWYWGDDNNGYPRYVKDFGSGNTAEFSLKYSNNKLLSVSFKTLENTFYTDEIIEKINNIFYIPSSSYFNGNDYIEFESHYSGGSLDIRAKFFDCNPHWGLSYKCSNPSISNCLLCGSDPYGTNPCDICDDGYKAEWDNNKNKNVCVRDQSSNNGNGNGNSGSNGNGGVGCNECINVNSLNVPLWEEKEWQRQDASKWLGKYCYKGKKNDNNYPIYELERNGVKAEISVSTFKNPNQLEIFIYFYENENDDRWSNYFMYIGSGAQLVNDKYIEINYDNNPFDGNKKEWKVNGYPYTLYMEAILDDNCPNKGFDVVKECISVVELYSPSWNGKDTSKWLGEYCYIGNKIGKIDKEQAYPVYELKNNAKAEITISPFRNPGELEFFLHLYENRNDIYPVAHFLYVGSGAKLLDGKYVSIDSNNNPFDSSVNKWIVNGYPSSIYMKAQLNDIRKYTGFDVNTVSNHECKECINVKSLNVPLWEEQEWQGKDTSKWLGKYCNIGKFSDNNYPIYELEGRPGSKAEITVSTYKNPNQLEFFIHFYENEDDDRWFQQFLYINSGAELVNNKYISINSNNNPFNGNKKEWKINNYPNTLYMEAELDDSCSNQGFDVDNDSPGEMRLAF